MSTLVFRPTTALRVFAVLMLFLALMLTAGCPADKTADQGASTTNAGAEGSDGEKSGSESSKPLGVGEKGSQESLEEIAVTKVEATDSLSSPAAAAALQTGGPGESPEPDTKAAAGNELLLITMTYKPKKPVNLGPAYLKLTDKDSKEYSEVSTSGYGGVFNNQPVEAGQEDNVTVVYEVPAGAKDLVFTIELFGEKPLEFSVR